MAFGCREPGTRRHRQSKLSSNRWPAAPFPNSVQGRVWWLSSATAGGSPRTPPRSAGSRTAVVLTSASPADLFGTLVAGAGLTTREVEVTRLLCRGLTDAEIAHQLTISTHDHVGSVRRKLGARHRSQVPSTIFADHYFDRLLTTAAVTNTAVTNTAEEQPPLLPDGTRPPLPSPARATRRFPPHSAVTAVGAALYVLAGGTRRAYAVAVLVAGAALFAVLLSRLRGPARDRTASRHVRAPLVPREGSQRRSGSPGGRLGRTGTHPETLSQTARPLTLDTTHPGLLRRPCRGQGRPSR